MSSTSAGSFSTGGSRSTWAAAVVIVILPSFAAVESGGRRRGCFPRVVDANEGRNGSVLRRQGWCGPIGGPPTAFRSKGERHEQRAERNAQQPPREAVVTPIAHDEPGNDAGRKPESEKDGQNVCAT